MRIYRIRKFPAKILLLFLVIALLAFRPKVLLSLKSFTFGILTKPFKALSGAKGYFTSRRNLSDENLLLKQRLGALSVELARMKEVALENERLRSLLKFKRSLPYRAIVAKVIARDSEDWRGAIIINRGRTHGIREHMPAATAKGLIGSVTEVGPATSKVMLITDPNSRVGVVLDPSRESGVLIGSPQGECRVIYLSLDSELTEGEEVLTAGFSIFFPRGLAIGKVKKTGIEKAMLYKYATLDLFEDMNKIEEVVCIDAAKGGKYK